MRYLFISILMVTLLAACDDDDKKCISGSGQYEVYTLDVGDFDKIDVEGVVDVTFTQGNNQVVTLRAEPEIYEILDYRVTDRTLVLDFDNRCVRDSRELQLDVTIPDLKYIGASGALELTNTGMIELDDLEVDISGSAEVQLAGTCTEITYVCSGAIDVFNFGLTTSITTIDVSGAGDFEVLCNDELNIDVSGAATVSYKGNPVINQNVSGSLDLTDAN